MLLFLNIFLLFFPISTVLFVVLHFPPWFWFSIFASIVYNIHSIYGFDYWVDCSLFFGSFLLFFLFFPLLSFLWLRFLGYSCLFSAAFTICLGIWSIHFLFVCLFNFFFFLSLFLLCCVACRVLVLQQTLIRERALPKAFISTRPGPIQQPANSSARCLTPINKIGTWLYPLADRWLKVILVGDRKNKRKEGPSKGHKRNL